MPLAGEMTASAFAVGQAVEAKVQGWKAYYKGVVTAYDAASASYAITFADGDKKEGVKGFQMRAEAGKAAFTAPDGTVFASKAEYRKYISETVYSFAGATGATLSRKAGEVAGQGFTIKDLSGCHASLMDHSDQVLVDNVDNCTILIGPSSESVFLRNAKNCRFFIACKQFRCRDCVGCTVSLYSKTEPVVETSSGMLFYPYAAAYPGQVAHFAKANLPAAHNHWCNVFDFNKGDSKYPEPHWALLPEAQGWPQWAPAQPFAAGEVPENPVPKDARAEVAPKEASFAIGLSQAQAAQTFAALEKANNQQAEPAPAPRAPLAVSPAAPPAKPASPKNAPPRSPLKNADASAAASVAASAASPKNAAPAASSPKKAAATTSSPKAYTAAAGAPIAPARAQRAESIPDEPAPLSAGAASLLGPLQGLSTDS